MRTGTLVVVTALGLALAAARAAPPPPASVPDAAALKKLNARLAPIDLTADVSRLPARERAALVAILRASCIMDALFLRQVSAGNETLLLDLTRDETALGRARLHAFLQNKGPWL